MESTLNILTTSFPPVNIATRDQLSSSLKYETKMKNYKREDRKFILDLYMQIKIYIKKENPSILILDGLTLEFTSLALKDLKEEEFYIPNYEAGTIIENNPYIDYKKVHVFGTSSFELCCKFLNLQLDGYNIPSFGLIWKDYCCKINEEHIKEIEQDFETYNFLTSIAIYAVTFCSKHKEPFLNAEDKEYDLTRHIRRYSWDKYFIFDTITRKSEGMITMIYILVSRDIIHIMDWNLQNAIDIAKGLVPVQHSSHIRIPIFPPAYNYTLNDKTIHLGKYACPGILSGKKQEKHHILESYSDVNCGFCLKKRKLEIINL